MCARRSTSAMPKSFLCCERAFCRSMVVMFCALKWSVLMSWCLLRGQVMWWSRHLMRCDGLCCVMSRDALRCHGDELYYSSTTLYYKMLLQILLCTTKYYSSTTLYYKVLLQYYKVLLKYYSSTYLVLQSTTLYYKSTTPVLKYHSVLQSTTPVLLCTTPVLLLYYKVLLIVLTPVLSTDSSTTLYKSASTTPSTTPVLIVPPVLQSDYSSTASHTNVLSTTLCRQSTPLLLTTTKCTPLHIHSTDSTSCTTKYYSSTTHYKVLLRYHPVLHSTTRITIWNVIYNARSNRLHPPTSPNTALATQNECHDWSASHMKRHLQCGEQQASPSNLTKYCACHAKWISWLIRITYETSFTMRGATGINLQPHQILRLPRKMTTSWLIRITYETSFTMRGATGITSKLSKYCACHAKLTRPTLRQKLAENRWNVISNARPIRPWSENPTKWSDPENANRNPHAPAKGLLFALARSRFYWKLQRFPLRLSFQISPNAAPATKSDTWTSPNAAPATKSDTWTSPNAAPATKSDTWTSPNAAPATKSDTWTSPNAAPATKSDTWTSPNAAPATTKSDYYMNDSPNAAPTTYKNYDY